MRPNCYGLHFPAAMEDKRIRVLLVEDNEDDIFILRKMLQKASHAEFTLEVSTTLSDAVEHLKKGGINIVLLDLKLPDSLGLDTFYTLHKEHPHIPIIVLSGADDDRMALEAVHAGAQ